MEKRMETTIQGLGLLGHDLGKVPALWGRGNGSSRRLQGLGL